MDAEFKDRKKHFPSSVKEAINNNNIDEINRLIEAGKEFGLDSNNLEIKKLTNKLNEFGNFELSIA